VFEHSLPEVFTDTDSPQIGTTSEGDHPLKVQVLPQSWLELECPGVTTEVNLIKITCRTVQMTFVAFADFDIPRLFDHYFTNGLESNFKA
jgi:hypothetical protein